jgi:rare lipoprotein A (peptidoglycan hydrolase)
VTDVQSQATEAQAKLDKMQATLSNGLSEYRSASADLSATRDQIKQNDKRLAQVRASLKAGQESLDQQAAFLYRTDGTGFVDVLLGSASFEQFAARLSVLQQIASKDAGLIEGLKRDRAEAKTLEASLAQKEARQKQLLGKVAAHRESVQSQIDQQQGYVNSLSSQVQGLLAAQAKAKAAEKTAAAPAADPGPSVSAPSPSKPSPPASSGSVKLATAKVTGRSGTYIVMASEARVYSPTGAKFSGGASVYSVSDNGYGTASGRRLNDNELTCAHRTLPFGTRVAVTCGSRRIICIVTDRGPYTSGRVIDLTKRGEQILGFDGVGHVSCEVVDPQ